MLNLKKRLIISNELSIKGGDYPSQYPKNELFRFFLRRAAGKSAANKVLLKMFDKRAPLEEMKLCVDTILNSYIQYTKQITKISAKKIKKMRQGLEIPKPKFLKNGFNYFDKEEILKLPDQLIKYYKKKSNNMNNIGDDLASTEQSTNNLEFICGSEKEMNTYFFNVLKLFYFSIKEKGLDSEIDFEDIFIKLCIKMEKWSLLLQLSQGGILNENMSLCLLFCELGSKNRLIDRLKIQFELIGNLNQQFLDNIPNLENKEFLQIGLQYLKKQAR